MRRWRRAVGVQSSELSDVGMIRREVHSSILNSIPDIKESLTAQVNEAIKKGSEELMEPCMQMFKEKINSCRKIRKSYEIEFGKNFQLTKRKQK